jgi:signal transduction histidine kinase
MVLLKCVPLLVLGFLSLITALLVIRRSKGQRSNMAFSILAFGVAGWVIGVAAFLLTNDTALAILFAKAYYFFPLLIGASMLILAYLFPNRRTVPLYAQIGIIWGFFLLAVLLLFDTNFLIKELVHHEWGKEVKLNTGPYVAYSAYIVLSFLASLIIFYRKSKRLTGLHRAQAKLLFIGISISAVFGVLFNLLLPGFGNYSLIHLGPLATGFFLVAIAYSIIRHRMFNVQLILVRSTAYVLTLMVIIALYGAVSYILSLLALNSIDNDTLDSIINVMLLVFVAITFTPLKKMFDRVTNKFFYRDAYDPQEFLDTLNMAVVANTSVDHLLKQSAQIISEYLKSQTVFFVLERHDAKGLQIVGGPNTALDVADIHRICESPLLKKHEMLIAERNDSNPELTRLLERLEIAVIAKLATNSRYSSGNVGYLILGPKKSGNLYSKQDANIVKIIANELVIAIENALRFEEIEQFNVTLQGRVNEATRKLRSTNEKLEAMDQTKDEFISMASHQLRTPLTSVKGYVSMVLEGDAGEINDMQRKLLEQAFASSQRMVYLIADLLNLSRLRTGKFIIEAVPTNLSDVIESEVEQLKETARSRSLKLAYTKPKSFPTLMLDETKVRQVIMNFVDNAIYYTPAGGKIEIKLTETKETVEFTVHDNGIGVPKSEQHHLFNKFYRARNAQKARPDGTGLGLFMAKKVIVAQGGAIIFRSTEGKGSAFGFTFSKKKLRIPEQK